MIQVTDAARHGFDAVASTILSFVLMRGRKGIDWADCCASRGTADDYRTKQHEGIYPAGLFSYGIDRLLSEQRKQKDAKSNLHVMPVRGFETFALAA